MSWWDGTAMEEVGGQGCAFLLTEKKIWIDTISLLFPFFHLKKIEKNKTRGAIGLI
jgi:hypothetical protein